MIPVKTRWWPCFKICFWAKCFYRSQAEISLDNQDGESPEFLDGWLRHGLSWSSWKHFSAITPSEPPSPGEPLLLLHIELGLGDQAGKGMGLCWALSGQLRSTQQPQSLPGALENLQVRWEAWPLAGPNSTPPPRILLGILFPEVKNFQPASQTGQLERECGIIRLPDGPLWGPGKVLSHGNFPCVSQPGESNYPLELTSVASWTVLTC